MFKNLLKKEIPERYWEEEKFSKTTSPRFSRRSLKGTAGRNN